MGVGKHWEAPGEEEEGRRRRRRRLAGRGGGEGAKVTRGKKSLFLYALFIFAMMFLEWVMDVLDHK